jgi:hypothetical protein
MNETLIILICTLPSIAFAVGAILLALNSISGWGWFLFIAFISNPGIYGLSLTSK